MSGLRIGELFAGYGGLGMGVQAALGGEVAWYSEIDKGALKILTHRFPDVPNLGDVTTVDWSQVEPVDVLTGGSPCQDLSSAGKRAGMTEGTRSNLWVAMREAIAQLRPGLVVWENVRGAYSAAADSDVEPCQGCMGDGSTEPALRALGRVLGDLSDLGYVGGWHGLRAADVGAPHGRSRVFVVARDAQSHQLGHGPLAETHRSGEDQGKARAADRQPLLPTPRASDGSKGGPNQRGSSGDLMLPSAVALLPTPTSSDYKGSTTTRRQEGMDRSQLDAVLEGRAARADLPSTPSANDAKGSRFHAGGNPMLGEAARLLPTPRTANNENRQSESHAGQRGNFHGLIQGSVSWGDYAPAIARWEQILGRPAPEPTRANAKGNPQLSAHFVEWLMGLDAGWVTDVPGITRNEALKALGNGVVPQQAEAALRFLLPRMPTGK